jgi:sensor histidine kinase YesM
MPQATNIQTNSTQQRSRIFLFFRDMVLNIILMFLLAGLLYVLEGEFMVQLRYCLAIGMSTKLAADVIMFLRGIEKPDLKTLVGAIIFGMLPGMFIGILLNGHGPYVFDARYSSGLLTLLAVSLISTLTISYFFQSRTVIAETTAALRQKELERILSQHQLNEANLRVLQAQIEPHFLFNTLSNILSLISTDPDKAERMLSNLTEYLRASLQQTRAERIELQDELATVRAFLEIMAVRMEKRLTYHIDVPPELFAMMIPPLLLQPLVENAVEHGIDPKPEGGTINVRAERDGDMLALEISDNGDGIKESNRLGVGMANIRERLKLLYHGKANFQVKVAVPHGTTIRLTIPIESGGAHE